MIITGVFPNLQVTSDDSRNNFVKKFRILFPVIADVDLKMTQLYNATITPEVIVVEANANHQKVIYRGMIDDSFISVGKRRSVVTRHYLRDALRQYHLGNPILPIETKPVGCIIQKKSH